MAIQVSVAQLKAAIKAIRSSFANEASPRFAQNLEEVSVAFGFPTWDALSAATKAPTNAVSEGHVVPDEQSSEGEALPKGAAVDVYVQCYNQADSEDALIPDWYKFRVNGVFLNHLHQMHAVVADANLSEARKFFYGFELQSNPPAIGSELVVGGEAKATCWFKVVTHLYRSSLHVESAAVSVSKLEEFVRKWIEEKRPYPLVFAGDEMARQVICEQLLDEGLLPDDVPYEVFPLA